ncbi:hypothetical protein HOB94_05145 [bacterium]|nr:hypothetical protein [bacterium]
MSKQNGAKNVMKYLILFIPIVYLSGCGESQTFNTNYDRLVTVSWKIPIENTDNSPLLDLMGFKIYYGVSESYLDNVIIISDPNINLYTIPESKLFFTKSELYYVSMTAYNSMNIESAKSNIVNFVY